MWEEWSWQAILLGAVFVADMAVLIGLVRDELSDRRAGRNGGRARLAHPFPAMARAHPHSVLPSSAFADAVEAERRYQMIARARRAGICCAVVLVIAIAAGSIAIAVATWQTVVPHHPGSEMALALRAGDNPWKYAWSAAGERGIAENSSSHAVDIARLRAVPPPEVKGKSFTILAEVIIPPEGGEGMIVTQGGLSGGWAFYVRNSRPVFHYNLDGMERYTVAAERPLAPGRRTLVVTVYDDAQGTGEGGVATIAANGEPIARGRIEKTRSSPFAFEEGLDIGEDRGTPVDLAYELPFKFNGELINIVLSFGRPASGSTPPPAIVYD
ncbi:MAG TPA: hypothetical protein VMA53_06120 [Stellaceae bacterium]|nr:hypothetical protein [Stellaceae bacterium]